MRSSLLTILVLSSFSTLSVAHNDEVQADQLSSNSPQIVQVADRENFDEGVIGTVGKNVTPIAEKNLPAQGSSLASKPALKNQVEVPFFQMLLNRLADPFGMGDFLIDFDLTGTV